jgi:hypothetical protein
MKRKYTLEDYKYDLGQLFNEKASLEWKIDKDQKFISNNHCDLGTNQFLYYKESIESYQKELKEISQKITNLKNKIQNYENAR